MRPAATGDFRVIGDVAAGGGLLVAACAAAFAVLGRPSRARAAAMIAALVLAPVLITGDAWDTPRFEDLRNTPARTAALVLAALALVAGLAWLVRRRPWLLGPLVVAALPFRVPLEAGGEQANLLVPLYLVIAAGVVAAATSPEWGRDGEREAPPALVWLRRALAGFVVLYALQALYSEDASRGLQNTCFFLVPFSVAFALLCDLRWDRRLLAACGAVAAAEAILFALVGLAQYATGELLWNDEVILANEFHPYFRVNSLFWDPNVLGRYLALVALAGTALLLWARDLRLQLVLIGGIALALATMAVTFSQSSYAALLAGLAVLAALRWSARWTGAVVAVALVAAGIAVALVADFSTSPKVNKDTGGRFELIKGGIELFADRPLWGYGSGSFSEAYVSHVEKGPALVSESHTEPVTVAAEQGLIGLAAFVALLAAAAWALTLRLRPVMPGLGGGRDARGPPDHVVVGRAAVIAMFVALVVHTVSYAGFFEDPITWVLLAVGSALAVHNGRERRAPASHEGPQPLSAPGP